MIAVSFVCGFLHYTTVVRSFFDQVTRSYCSTINIHTYTVCIIYAQLYIHSSVEYTIYVHDLRLHLPACLWATIVRVCDRKPHKNIYTHMSHAMSDVAVMFAVVRLSVCFCAWQWWVDFKNSRMHRHVFHTISFVAIPLSLSLPKTFVQLASTAAQLRVCVLVFVYGILFANVRK